MEPLFSPSLHTQRHQYVIDFIKRNKPKKVVDLGCNDCLLLRKLKFHREIELLSGVDINDAAMKKQMYALGPIPTDYLDPGYSPLSIELYQGSVTQKDARLRGFDLVTGVELIEHLHLADVDPFSEVLFGYMTPASVIISTPNAEFNPLFPRMPGFRNHDHKFEWTRAEFQSWALKVCERYGYEAEFTGVGQAPAHLHVQVGFCTQIGVFRRLAEGGAGASSTDAPEIFSYTLVYSVSYPSLHDNNILQGCLVSELLYCAHKLGGRRKSGSGLEEVEEGSTASKMEEDGNEKADGGQYEEEGNHREAFRMTSRGQQQSHRHGQGACVLLSRVWSSCRRIRDLSGTLARLKIFIADNPLITLTQDGLAVVLDEEQEDSEEEEVEDTEGIEARVCTPCAVEEENWEDEL